MFFSGLATVAQNITAAPNGSLRAVAPGKKQLAGQCPAGQKKSIGFVYFNQPQYRPIVPKKMSYSDFR
jgi:hypothetical protein